jgi:hypothetical protein
MNLLKVQDALKNASDQQLMTLMQSPDSTAPSYLVLSEIRRRKDMRNKQAPEGQSNRTVADDLIAQDDGGIRDIVAHDEPEAQDGAEEMAAGGLASLRRYAEGGVVRMQAGGDIMGDIPFPAYNYEDMTIPQPLTGRDALFATPRPVGPGREESNLSAAQRDLQSRIQLDPRMRGNYSLVEQVARQYGVTPFALRDAAARGAQTEVALPAPGGNQASGSMGVSPLGADAPMRPQAGELGGVDYNNPYAGAAPLTGEDPLGGPPPPSQGPRPTEQPSAPRPSAAQPTAAPGIEGLRNTPTGIPEGGQLPSMAELMRQNAALFPDGMGSIRDRMREERVDPAARRSQAINMALIEAGLRVAGSRNPSLMGAIGEGALPAVQGYGQQLGQIRAEQRQARQDELELAKQDTNRQFAIGQISAAEYRSRMENINANIRASAQERGANARLAASEDAANRRADRAAAAAEDADLRRGYASPERLARMSPEERAAFERVRTLGRPLDTSGVQGAYNATVRQIDGIRSSMEADPRPAASSRNFAEWQQRDTERRARLQQAENQLREYRDILVTGRAPGGSGGTTQVAPNSSGRPDLSSFAR